MAQRAISRRRGVVVAAVRPIAERVAGQNGLVLWDVAFSREAGVEVLRVGVDRRGGVDSEEIARVSEVLSREIDAADAVPGESRYVLEVGSPGAERKLRSPEEFGVCVGRHARITFKNGREPIEDVIARADADGVAIGGIDIAYSEISHARLMVPEAHRR